MALSIEQTPTPQQYPQFDLLNEVPKTLPTIDILKKTPTTWGLVTTGDGFLDTPDTESITGGIHSKGPNYVAIGRQGRFFMWGFYGSPDDLTDAGRALLLNSIVYISKFKDAPVLGFRAAIPRDSAATSLSVLPLYGAEPAQREQVKKLLGAVPPIEDFITNKESRKKWFVENRPYLRRVSASGLYEGSFVVDLDAKALGIPNDDPKILERCVADLEAGRDAERALGILRRYTNETFADAAAWRAWLDANKGKLYFSDWNGYKFRVRTERDAEIPTKKR